MYLHSVRMFVQSFEMMSRSFLGGFFSGDGFLGDNFWGLGLVGGGVFGLGLGLGAERGFVGLGFTVVGLPLMGLTVLVFGLTVDASGETVVTVVSIDVGFPPIVVALTVVTVLV